MSSISLENKEKKLEIKDESLINASGFALIEAMRWGETSDSIINKHNLRVQTCISALFSIELYMKAILMSDMNNVKKYKHNLYLMYNAMNKEIKDKIKNNIRIDKKVIAGLTNEELIFNTFEEQLKYIANDYVYLRYEYEKFLNGYSIITFTDFITSLKNNIQTIAFEYVGNKQKDCNNR